MNCRTFLALLSILLGPVSGWAWGPHSEITQAAIDVLPAQDPLRELLGPEIARLRETCWMGDQRRSLRSIPTGSFYADDYLLFPPMSIHRDHLCPEVMQTYEPFFRRALLALRTESPQNAARWIGSILHFTEDTGSPPHAGQIRGEVHSKMENWLDAKAIVIVGYQPQILGSTEETAIQGFLKRMDGLIEFSKQRAERAKPLVLSGDRPSTEPIVLESALETSRVVADLLCTLGHLARQPEAVRATLFGRISSASVPGLEQLPAKLMLRGTNYSTLADPDGHYEFHNLPPGEHIVLVLKPGNANSESKVQLAAGQSLEHNLSLAPDRVPGNLVRNPTADPLWLNEHQPDCWYPVKRRADAPNWESDLIPVKAGCKYEFNVQWQDKAEGQVLLRIIPKPSVGKPPEDLAPLLAGQTTQSFSPSEETAYTQLIIYSNREPKTVIQHIALHQLP